MAEAELLEQYGCGPVQFSGSGNASYERHLIFDNVMALGAAGSRERFEALARSVRDLLSQRWVRTEEHYDRRNPKRVYYLSMEYLIGRSLANNLTNLLLDPFVRQAAKQEHIDPVDLLEQEPDAGLGNGGLGRLAACFLDSMATMALPAMGYGLRYEYGIFKQTIQGGWQQEQPDNWLRNPDPWEVARPREKIEVPLNCSFEVRGGSLQPIPGRPSKLIGVPYDRPVVGFGGKTINTLRLWAATTPDSFDFKVFSHGDFVSAVAETLAAGIAHAGALSGRFDQLRPGPALYSGIFPGRLFPGGLGAALPADVTMTGTNCRRRWRSNSMTPIPRWRCRS